MKAALLALIALLLAAPLAAQSLRDCDTFEANARNTYAPYAETIRDYANGAIRVIALDVGEPACCSFHVMVVHPLPDEPFPGCTLVSLDGTLGFSALDMANADATYDSATGLTVHIPAGQLGGDPLQPVLLDLTINQATGSVVPTVMSGIRMAPLDPGK